MPDSEQYEVLDSFRQHARDTNVAVQLCCLELSTKTTHGIVLQTST